MANRESGGIQSITVLNPGFGYNHTPTVEILGDGTGATAQAIINTNGQITSIEVLTAGQNYTQATVVITPASNDSTGQGGAAVAVLHATTTALTRPWAIKWSVMRMQRSITNTSLRSPYGA